MWLNLLKVHKSDKNGFSKYLNYAKTKQKNGYVMHTVT